MTAADWQAIHARLERARLAYEQAAAPGAEEAQRTLKARARTLARRIEPAGAPGDALEVVAFTVAGESYAVESAYVRQVYPLKALTRLPGAPAFVLGIVYLRGRVLTVIDIKKFFDLPDKGLSDLNKLVVLHNDSLAVGVLADAVEGVRLLPIEELQPGLAGGTGARAEYVKGTSRERLVMLAAERILSDPKLLVQQQGAGLTGG